MTPWHWLNLGRRSRLLPSLAGKIIPIRFYRTWPARSTVMGLQVEVVHRTPGGNSIAECLLQEAFERGADMIVTGAFGHSRLFDFAIGAVTLELMRKADRPVLFST